MNIKLQSIINMLIKLLIVSTFFDAYAIVYVGSYPVTAFTIVSVLIFINGLYVCIAKGSLKLDTSVKIALFMILYIIINFVITGCKNITSLLLSEFFFITYIFTYRQERRSDFDSYISIFIKGMNILAIYGIYQFLARMYSLPFGDIIIPNHMVAGYNWTNSIYIAGLVAQRSNAIFREPSFFSQYLAINILLYVIKVLKKDKSVTSLLMITLNSLAMIISFSGTGFIILVFSGLIYLIAIKKDKQIILRIIKIAIPIFITFLLILNTPIGTYFLTRLSEVFVYTTNRVSGYVRFRSGIDVLKAAWDENWIFGIGIGTSNEFILNLPTYYPGMTINGFYRTAIELGVLGWFLWILFVFSFWRKKYSIEMIQILICILFPFMFCHETFMSNYYWIILYLLNTKIVLENKKDKLIIKNRSD